MENTTTIPRHVAIIMDGNRRWARKNNVPISKGHKVGSETLRKIVDYAYDIGIEYLTVYAFSTENWNRDEKEISAIMKLIYEFTKQEIENNNDKDICIKIYGDESRLSEKIKNNLYILEEKTKSRKRLVFGICLNYGGREEIIMSIKNICNDVINNKINIEDIDYKVLENKLYTGNIPDPDLVIRTSGEMRLSNFLPMQNVYSELYFTSVFWPDFDELELDKAILEFSNRKRRYGK
jgi:undecaprenyl diphosphate synthase